MKKSIINTACKIFTLNFLLLNSIESRAQGGQIVLPYWPDSVFVAAYNLSFRVPMAPSLHTEQNLNMYAIPIDSTLALQAQFFDSAYFKNNNILVDSALQFTNGDTMAAMAVLFASTTNSTISMYNNGSIGNKSYIDVGLDYQTLGSNVPYRTYIRFFYYNKRFIAFAVTGYASDDPRLSYYRGLFFPSVTFY